MRYYKKEHTIKMSLIGLFPHRIDDENLLSQIKESYEAEGLDYNVEAQRLEKMQEESFLEKKDLLLEYAPETLKPYIKSNSIFPIRNLSNEVLSYFNAWSQSLHKEVTNVFDTYNQYIKSIKASLPNGFKELTQLYLHDAYVINHCREKDRLSLVIENIY